MATGAAGPGSAVVIGAEGAGLAAPRAPAQQFDRVLIVDRHELSEDPVRRRGGPARRPLSTDGPDFYRAASAPIATTPWSFAVDAGFAYPEAVGPRPLCLAAVTGTRSASARPCSTRPTCGPRSPTSGS